MVQPLDRRVERALRGERAHVQLVDHRAGQRRARASRASVQRKAAMVIAAARPLHAVRLPRRARVGQRRPAVQPERVVGAGGCAGARRPPTSRARRPGHGVPVAASDHLDLARPRAPTPGTRSRPAPRCGTAPVPGSHRSRVAGTSRATGSRSVAGQRGRAAGWTAPVSTSRHGPAGSGSSGVRPSRRAAAARRAAGWRRSPRGRPCRRRPGRAGTTTACRAAGPSAASGTVVPGEPAGMLAAQPQRARDDQQLVPRRGRPPWPRPGRAPVGGRVVQRGEQLAGGGRSRPGAGCPGRPGRSRPARSPGRCRATPGMVSWTSLAPSEFAAGVPGSRRATKPAIRPVQLGVGAARVSAKPQHERPRRRCPASVQEVAVFASRIALRRYAVSRPAVDRPGADQRLPQQVLDVAARAATAPPPSQRGGGRASARPGGPTRWAARRARPAGRARPPRAWCRGWTAWSWWRASRRAQPGGERVELGRG